MIFFSDPEADKQWHRIFALYPRRIGNHPHYEFTGKYLVWLGYVWRRYLPGECEDHGRYQHRFGPGEQYTEPGSYNGEKV